MTATTNSEYLGEPVQPGPAAEPDTSMPLRGRFVTLEGLSKEHVPRLHRALDIKNNKWLDKWLPFPPMDTEEDMAKTMDLVLAAPEVKFYAVATNAQYLNIPLEHQSPDRGDILGMMGYLNISTENRELEAGGMLFSLALQGTVAATEAQYLLLRNVFERTPGSDFLPYRRVCWKCNSLNIKSRRAAERLGYTYEGTFRNHMIVKGHSRDSDWLSIVDSEWPVVKAALEQWLSPSNFDEQGRQKRRLDDMRAAIREEGSPKEGNEAGNLR